MILEKIQNSLYNPHWEYWYRKLQNVISENCGYQGRGRPSNYCKYGIFYLNQPWFVPQPEAARTEASDFDIVPLHPEYPELESRLIKITSNLAELDIETYEVKRFLAGMLMFPAPIETFEESLGRSLFGKIGPFLRLLNEEERHKWNDNLAKAYRTFMQENDYLIDAMCQRVMMNLIARDAFMNAKQ